jgi:hypothetical protein
MRKTELQILYPFQFDGRKRIFKESKAGIQIKFNMTIPEAEAFVAELTETLELIKDFIAKQKVSKENEASC